VGAPLAVGGARLRWEELPARIAAALTARFGATVVAVEHKDGGFSPGFAGILRSAEGDAVFVKAVGLARNEISPGMYRREAEVLAVLPPDVPAPRLRWTYDDGDWVAVATEALDGSTPAQPWRRDELSRFLALAEDIAGRPGPVGLPSFAELHGYILRGWRWLAGTPDVLDAWCRRHLDRLVELECRWEQAVAGTALLHGDLRADNAILTPKRAVAVDWPHACVGAGWVDLLLGIPSIVMHGGGDPGQLWSAYQPGSAADPDAVNAVLAAAAGYFVHSGQKPSPPNLPNVRAFQRAQGDAALAWLRRRLA
jgi:hypothetical protein